MTMSEPILSSGFNVTKKLENIPKLMTNKQESDSFVVIEEEMIMTFGAAQHNPETAK